MKHFPSLPVRLLRMGIIGILAVVTVLPVTAQRAQPSSDEDLEFWGSPSAYLNYQAKIAYPLIDRMLKAFPPAVEPDINRRMALIALDQFLHDADYDRRNAFGTFFNTRMAHMLEGIDNPLSTGIRIYKLYNSGFIIRTPETTVAIDLVPGGMSNKPFLSDSAVSEIVRRCAALIITNTDKSHANRSIAWTFAGEGKKVILPEELWTNLDGDIVRIGADTEQTIDLAGMKLHLLPGHNGQTANSICVMDFNGRGVVAHTGAQDNEADLEWIDRIHTRYDIDVLLTKTQSPDLEAIITGFKPDTVITCHENELENTFDKRESYWITQKRMKNLANLNVPNVIMTWGEAYDCGNSIADTQEDTSTGTSKRIGRDGILYIKRNGAIYTPAGIKVN